MNPVATASSPPDARRCTSPTLVVGLAIVLCGLAADARAQTQMPPTPLAAPASAASAPPSGPVTNKAAKPPVDAAASRSGVATKKPAKAGAQAGPASAASR